MNSFMALILWKSLQPIYQKEVLILGCSFISTPAIIRGSDLSMRSEPQLETPRI
ncbi:hypothetical protein AXF42_Ash006674 [Apostasia shenzhenica]|uniref:Uncharacterized protein n=1 Tax=Apostasia shenzhenica TaxID=1088818 RepID=A0A2I0AIS7_9ASPA|nr:hypothetical protein AXF42_Ash006674 [Apostasia shenzhenica]